MNKKVLIIGNGFDLSLGRRTRYSDFASNASFWPFKEPSFTGLAHYMCEKSQVEGWLDIERELQEYATNHGLGGNIRDIEGDYNQYWELKYGLSNYLAAVEKTEKILTESVAAKVLRGIIQNGFFKDIFTFNYTNLGIISNRLSLGNISFHYVHGSIENNDIVLGIDDHSNIIEGYEFLYKTFDKNYPSTPIQYSLQEADEVVIFGHSLGKTDYHYFQNFFKTQSQRTMSVKEKKKITIFTYDEASRMNILKQLHEMNDEHSLTLLFANNDVQIICTDGRDPKDDEKLSLFLEHLDKCSVKSLARTSETLSDTLF